MGIPWGERIPSPEPPTTPSYSVPRIVQIPRLEARTT